MKFKFTVVKSLFTKRTLAVALTCTSLTLAISSLCLYLVVTGQQSIVLDELLGNASTDYQDATRTLNAKGMSPVIPMQMEFQDSIFLDYALQHSDIGSVPDGEYEAERLANALRQTLDDLKFAKGERKADLVKDAFDLTMQLAYFQESVIRQSKDKARTGQLKANLNTLRNQAKNLATTLIRTTKDKKTKATLTALQQILNAQQGRGVAGSINRLQKNPNVPAPLKRRLIFAAAITKKNSRNSGERLKTARQVAATKLTGPRLAEQRVGTWLYAAQLAAGLNQNGQVITKSNSYYRKALYQASIHAASLQDSEKSAFLSQAVYIWWHAEGKKDSKSWHKVPLRMSSFTSEPVAKALLERRAIAYWQANQLTRAINTYQALSNDFQGQLVKMRIDERLLNLHRTIYAKNRNFHAYEKKLSELYSVYVDPNVLGSANQGQVKQMEKRLAGMYGALTLTELKRVKGKATHREKNSALDLARRYLTQHLQGSDRREIKESMAEVHISMKQYTAAVSIYKELADTTKDQMAKLHYSKKAVAVQSILANWPSAVPWDQKISANPGNSEREELMKLYRNLLALHSQDWFLIGHIGLLEVSLGREDLAFKEWSEALEKLPVSSHSHQAAGFMMLTFEQSRRWSELENIARLSFKKNLKPVAYKKSLSPYHLLSLALLEQGKDALSQNQFKLAVEKLADFTKNFTRAANYDEGFYLLSRAHWGNGDHPKSIDVLVQFSKQFKKSRFYRAALLDGCQFSLAMAFEKNIPYFHKEFVTKFPKDEFAAEKRAELSSFYLGQGFYAEAIWVYEEDLKYAQGPQDRVATMNKIMNLQEKFGSLAAARATADRLLKIGGSNPDVMASALAVKTAYAIENNNHAEMRSLEKELSQFASTESQASEALAKVYYQLALLQIKGLTDAKFNLALKDPSATIESKYQHFRKVKAAFEKVCQIGVTSQCSPALHRLARVSEDLVPSLEDIEIQDTLAKELVDKFNQRKQQVINQVVQTIQTSDQNAARYMSETYTSPSWTQAVLWQSGSDWIFNRVSGDTGNSFLQWDAKYVE